MYSQKSALLKHIFFINYIRRFYCQVTAGKSNSTDCNNPGIYPHVILKWLMPTFFLKTLAFKCRFSPIKIEPVYDWRAVISVAKATLPNYNWTAAQISHDCRRSVTSVFYDVIIAWYYKYSSYSNYPTLINYGVIMNLTCCSSSIAADDVMAMGTSIDDDVTKSFIGELTLMGSFLLFWVALIAWGLQTCWLCCWDAFKGANWNLY